MKISRDPPDEKVGSGPALAVEALLGLDASDAEERDVYRTGELKREFGVAHRTLRAYEEKGFLHPARQGIRRLYSQSDRKRLRLFILSEILGFTPLEASQIVDIYIGS